jgi:hypothetical protein
MSTKKRYIQNANLISEQRYLNTRSLMEVEDPVTPPKQTDVASMGVNTNDVATQQSILTQLQPYSNKVDLEILKPLVGTENFFNKLNEFIILSPDVASDKKTITGEEVKLQLPGGIKLKATFGLGTGGKVTGVNDVGITKNVGPVNFGVKYKNPTDNFNISNLQVGAKITIPQTNKNKPHGTML